MIKITYPIIKIIIRIKNLTLIAQQFLPIYKQKKKILI